MPGGNGAAELRELDGSPGSGIEKCIFCDTAETQSIKTLESYCTRPVVDAPLEDASGLSKSVTWVSSIVSLLGSQAHELRLSCFNGV